jgi:membrane fusion protein (multidrug efflux system)
MLRVAFPPETPRRAPAIFAGLGAVLCALAAGCDAGEREAPGGGAPEPVVVELARVEPETLRDVATFSGELDAEHSVVLKTETDGVIASVEFEEGQEVTRGAVLFNLRSEEQAARLREAVAMRALAREVYDRTQKLVSRDATSLAQKDRATAELEVGRARVELARVALDRTEIRAPFDGVVGMRLVSPGDRVTDETPLVQIDAVDRLQVSFAVSEQGVAFAEVRVPVEVRVLPYPGETFPGEVFFASPTLDPATRRIVFKAWVPNADGRLRPGLFANVDVEIARREGALLVPESAVVFDRQGTYVWRADGDQAAARVPVELGLRKGGRVEVTMGLRPGDTIVTAGTHKVSEGRTLRAAARPPTGQARRGPAVGAESGEGS